MLEDGLSYPTRGEWTGRLIIGSMLWVFGSVLVFPLVLAYGYTYRAVRTTVRGQPEPPAWDDWGKHLIDGLKGLLVSFVYALIPNVVAGGVLFVLVVVVAGASPDPDPGAAAALGGITLVGFLVVGLLNLLVVFLTPAALTTFAAEDSAGAALSVGHVVGFALSGTYILALLQSAFVVAFAAVVASTVLLAPAALFWAGVALGRLFGTAYREEMGAPTDGGRAAAGTDTDGESAPASPDPDAMDGPGGRSGGEQTAADADRTGTRHSADATRDRQQDATGDPERRSGGRTSGSRQGGSGGRGAGGTGSDQRPAGSDHRGSGGAGTPRDAAGTGDGAGREPDDADENDEIDFFGDDEDDERGR